MSAPSAMHVMEHHATTRPAHGLAVVLVHGSLDRGASFARVVRRLGDLHVVTYDRRGYNHSRAMPLARSLEEHVDDLVALCGSGPAVVIGHSYGGDVALGAALSSPTTIRAVGAYEPPLPWMDWWPRRSASSIANEDPASFAEAFFGRVVGEGGWNRLSPATREARRADGPALVAELADLRRSTPAVDVARLEVPLVLGRGRRSIPHHRRSVDALVELVPHAQVVEIAGAAHGAHLTHPDAFADLVRLVAAAATDEDLNPQ